MKVSRIVAVGLSLVATLATTVAVAQDPKPAAGELKDLKTKASYCLGLSIGRQFKGNDLDVDPSLVAKGLADAFAGGKPLLTDEEIQKVMQEFQTELVNRKMVAAKSAGDKNKKEGEDFLAANKAKEGVKSLPSGLQYKVLKEGAGATPKATDTVKTHYKGTLIDGTEFDSSYKRGQPAEFPVNGVIAGWTEALQKMKVGSKWQLFIPANLAYGENGPPGSPIGPNAVLLFDIELLGIQ